MKQAFVFVLFLVAFIPVCLGAPRLVLQITVDGLRGDLLSRYQHHFGEGGFRYLMDEGVFYTDAHYQHANTETIVGQATLATGAQPAVHGMVGNVWYDASSGELAYNIEDPGYPLLPTRKETIKGAQVDPAQRMARSDGRSPRALLVPTFADTLAAAHGGNSKIFAVSGKDRGAVSMAGQVGKAFWYSTDSGDFQTSRYYYDSYPDWASAWNAQRKAQMKSGQTWTLLRDQADYVWGDRDDRPYEVDLKGYGRSFPHAYGDSTHTLFATRVMISPAGDYLTMDFARTLLDAEELGRDDTTDFLAVSFSGVDAVNHFFGVASLENEDQIVQLDRTLAEFFQYVDKRVGLDRTLIVLSADHGMSEMPEYMQELGFPAERLYNEQLLELASQLSEQRYGVEGMVKTFFRPSLYLNHDVIKAAGLDPEKVAIELAAELSTQQGISLAMATTQLLTGQYSGIAAQMQRNSHASRSGDIYVAQAPYWFMFEKGAIAAMHGSPWRYDTHVPVIFAGSGIKAQRVARRVHPVDVAPTLSAMLGLSAPAGSEGQVLSEVVLNEVVQP